MGEVMVLTGTIVNAWFIIFGSMIGIFFTNLSESMKTTVLKGIGLTVTLLGIQMGIQTNNLLAVIMSVVVGSLLGEWLKLDDKFKQTGKWLEAKIGYKAKGSIAQGFITATLIFVIGAMSIVGALDSGIRGDHQVLYTKAMIDGFTAIILTSTLGIGVMFSSIPVFLYQGTIALFATQINNFIPAHLLDLIVMELTATGGILIMGIGLNMLELIKIKVANMLPSILVITIVIPIVFFFNF
jgi:uncharacterized protein